MTLVIGVLFLMPCLNEWRRKWFYFILFRGQIKKNQGKTIIGWNTFRSLGFSLLLLVLKTKRCDGDGDDDDEGKRKETKYSPNKHTNNSFSIRCRFCLDYVRVTITSSCICVFIIAHAWHGVRLKHGKNTSNTQPHTHILLHTHTPFLCCSTECLNSL